LIVSDIFTKRQTIITYSIKELTQMLAHNRLTIKETNKLQVRLLKKYMINNILTRQVYIPPLVAQLKEGSLADGKPTRLVIIDGTQRVKALTQLQAAVQKAISSDEADQREKGFRLHYMLDNIAVSVQVFEGLTDQEANQLYIDLNTKVKKVALSKGIVYDSRNDINKTTSEVLKRNLELKVAGVDLEKRAVMRPKNKNLLSLSQLRQLVACLLTAKTSLSQATLSAEVPYCMEDRVQLVNSWFEALFNLYPAEKMGHYETSMLASFPLLKAVAIYAVIGTENMSMEGRQEELGARMARLQSVDWSSANELWRAFDGSIKGATSCFYLANNKKNIMGIVAWLELQGRCVKCEEI